MKHTIFQKSKKLIVYSFAIFFILISILSQSQNNPFEYDWEEIPIYDTVLIDTSYQAIVIKDIKKINYLFESDEFSEFYLVHKKIKLLTNDAIDDNNKIYIPLSRTNDILLEKARVINPDGTIINLNNDDFYEGKYEESGTNYRYFVFKGIEINSEIEYLYILKRDPLLNGSIISNVQSDYPKQYFSVDICSPSHLFFVFKSYNGFNDFIYDTLSTEQNIWTVEQHDIPKLKFEEQSAYKANSMKYIYKLEKNISSGSNNIYSYGKLSSNVFENVYNSFDKKNIKAIKKINKAINVNESDNIEKKIRDIENYFRENYTYVDNNNFDFLSNPLDIYDNKAFNNTGAIYILANLFKMNNIKHEIVITNNRFEHKFDTNFEAYYFLDDYLFYFPDIEKYMYAAGNLYRLGFPPIRNINNHGLFISEIKVGDFSTGIGEIKFIEAPNYKESNNIINCNVDFENDFSSINIDLVLTMTGYNADPIQPVFSYITDEEKLDEFSESIVKYIDEDGIINSLEFEYNKAEYLGQKPLITKTNITSTSFIEKAGENILFKVGELIGPQMEMYQDNERINPIESYYTRSYYRTIEFEIPNDYYIQNIEKLNINEVYEENSDTLMAFFSNYKINDNKVFIEVVEYYKTIDVPVELVNEYRRIVNSAADFNKIVLLLSKK